MITTSTIRRGKDVCGQYRGYQIGKASVYEPNIILTGDVLDEYNDEKEKDSWFLCQLNQRGREDEILDGIIDRDEYR